MKVLSTLSLLMILALPLLAGEHTSASGWFDMENCAFCKSLTEDPELLAHVTWENHKIQNGSMTITTVDPAYAAAYAKASKAMEDLGTKMTSGEVNPMEVKMCGHCQAFGQLMMAGVRMEKVVGEAAEVMLLTSDDPNIVAMIHEMTDRDIEEMKLMAAGGDHDH